MTLRTHARRDDARSPRSWCALCCRSPRWPVRPSSRRPRTSTRPSRTCSSVARPPPRCAREYPIITDPQIAGYLERAGNSLVAVAPRELNHAVFEYSFTPVNLKEINAFALPGGPMFVNRGMFDAAQGEGEVVGVMAHELAHVLLRHGTANATKAQNFQIGAIAGAIAGAIIGGGWGEVISQGSQFGLGAWLMKYSREYEKQADLLGAQMMARAGFDPRDLAKMFETIEREGEGQHPAAVAEQSPQSGQPLAVHPAGSRQAHHRQPAGRQRFREREVEVCGAAGRQVDGRHHARRRQWQRRRRGPGVGRHRRAAGPGALDAIPHRSAAGSCSRSACPPTGPACRAAMPSSSCPRTGWASTGARTSSRTAWSWAWRGRRRAISARRPTPSSTRFCARTRGCRSPAASARWRISQRAGIGTVLTGRSALNQGERVGVYTTFLADGNLFYYLTVVPERDAEVFGPAFDRVGNSIRLNDR